MGYISYCCAKPGQSASLEQSSGTPGSKVHGNVPRPIRCCAVEPSCGRKLLLCQKRLLLFKGYADTGCCWLLCALSMLLVQLLLKYSGAVVLSRALHTMQQASTHLCITPSSWQWFTTSTIFLNIWAACNTTASKAGEQVQCRYAVTVARSHIASIVTDNRGTTKPSQQWCAQVDMIDTEPLSAEVLEVAADDMGCCC